MSLASNVFAHVDVVILNGIKS